jgi:hypothetical protein
MTHAQAEVHRMFELVEPIATVTFSATVIEASLALGMRNYWDGYFAAQAAPLGPAPAEVVHAALSLGLRVEEFGRIISLFPAQVAGVVDGLRDRGLVNPDGGFTDAARGNQRTHQVPDL